MTTYKAPIADIHFLLEDLLGLYAGQAPYLPEELTADLGMALLAEAGKLAEQEFAPLNRGGDVEGCKLVDGQVRTPTGFKDAYSRYCEGGWLGMVGDPTYGGQGLPQLFGLISSELFGAANWSLSMYPGLTRPAAETIHAWGTEAQKALYLPRMYEGVWSGTMNLTEPHCGTDLGQLRTKAKRLDDGTFAISGTKIFITAGDQDLTENIIHLVLARIEGAPEGTGGISLFIVPKYQIQPDGQRGPRNNVACVSLEEKMGIHGSATCVMQYDGAVGTLLGQENKGMRAMFTMMNEARLGCGMQGVALAEAAQQKAVAYSRERLQGQAPAVTPAGQVADPIIMHPDVRRMLMTNRAFIEGGRAMALWCGLQVDIARGASDEAERASAEEILAVATPVIKAYLTDQGVEATSRAMQCFGGHGYIQETGIEQYLRDARIAPIYEGANGIQAMDLAGRKIFAGGGQAVARVLAMMEEAAENHAASDALKPHARAQMAALVALRAATQSLQEKGRTDPVTLGAVAHYYLNLFGVTLMGYIWLQMMHVSLQDRSALSASGDFLDRKFLTGCFFFENMFPDYLAWASKLEASGATTMAIAPDLLMA